jgi:hypothetical protein
MSIPKVLLFASSLTASCTLILGARELPRCGDRIRDPGELCLIPTEVFASQGAEYSVIADLNADSLPDVAAGDNNGFVEVYLNQGKGKLSEPALFTASPNEFINCIVSADFNNDGAIDLATANSATFSVLLNDTQGNFTTANTLPGCLDVNGQSACNATNWIASGDLDNDGDIDIVIADENSSGASLFGLGLWLNDGSANFEFLQNVNLGNNERSAYVTDFNQDGDIEILGVTADGHVDLVESTGASLFFAPTLNFPVSPGATTAAATDFNGDGFADMLTANDAGDISIFSNPVDRSLNLVSGGDLFLGGSPRTVIASDFDGDQDADAIITNDEPDLGLTFLENKGDESFTTRLILTDFGKFFGVVSGDLNQDGLPDFVGTANNFAGAVDKAFLVVFLSNP